MSKAFTRESETEVELSSSPRLVSPLPPGARNYITQDGERRLREELNQLLQIERPNLLAAGGIDVKERLRSVDQRILYLQQSLQSALIVPPPDVPDGRVRFGANVTVRHQNGERSSYRIVGVDETDIDRGWVSWLSPIAKALLKAERGQKVRFRFPSGEEELEIVEVSYA